MVETNLNLNSNLTYKHGMAPAYGAIPGANSETLNQAIQDNYVANRLSASQDANPLAVLGVTVPLWYGIAQGMEKLNAKCGVEYEKTIFGKIGAAGDKFTQNTFIGKKLDQFMNWVEKIINKSAKNSKIAYSLKNHSTRPEWSFARNMGSGLLGFLSNDTEDIMGKYMDPVKSAQKLEQYGLTQDKIDIIENALKGKEKAEKLLILQKEELKLLGVSEKHIQRLEQGGIQRLKRFANRIKAQRLGFRSFKHYQSLKGKFLDNPEEIYKVLEKGAKHGTKISIWRSGFKLKDHLFGRIVSIPEYFNKYKVTLGKGNSTRLGRFSSKFMGYLLEGGTNRFAGGKLAVFMQAYILGDMLVHAWNAPKGEKGKTFIERFVNDFTYFLAMPIAVLGMHKLGGFKYAGMSKEEVSTFRAALAKFNENVKNNVFKTKETYNAAKLDLKNLLGLKNIKNPITKILQKAGSFLNIGNERILSFRSGWFKKFFNSNIIGAPMRFLLVLMAISPMLATAATKTAHAIFGKPTYSVLDEGKEQQTESVEQMQLGQNESQQLNQQNNSTVQHSAPVNSTTNLLNKYKTV